MDEYVDEWELMFANELEAEEDLLEKENHVSRIKPKALNFDSDMKFDAEKVLCTNTQKDSSLEQKIQETTTDSSFSQNEHPEKNVDSFIYFRPPMDSDSVTCTLKDGTRFYLKKKNDHSHLDSSNTTSNISWGISSIALDTPIASMLEKIERRQVEKAALTQNTPTSTELTDGKSFEPRELWVKKYSPKRFIELLSDEKVNRDVLGWIKSWDVSVFPSKKDKLFKHSKTSANKSTPLNKLKLGDVVNSKDDSVKDVGPIEKVILLCGPPGAGKTTLAHIAAKHAGYNPIEINASDERTGNVLKERIINAMGMHSVWGDNKPNCVILDEIDGAMNGPDGKSAISSILSLINAPSATEKKQDKKQSGGNHRLTRPLICICNDQYAPVLRSLRKVAKVILFSPPTQKQLVSRLKTVSRLEKLTVSSGILTSICENAENDIRYCLNVLQLAKNSGESHITQLIIDKLMQKKDQTKSYYDLWGAVFCSRKMGRFTSNMDEPKAIPLTDLYDVAQQSGYDDVISNGLHENLPKMVFNDSTLCKTVDCLEWIAFTDICNKRIMETQQYSLVQYVPASAVAIHHACLSTSRRKIEYPRGQMDMRLALKSKMNIAQDFLEKLAMHSAIRCNIHLLSMDILSSLLSMLSPVKLHSNYSNNNPKQQEVFESLVRVHGTLGLSYRKQELSNGFFEYMLDPPIDQLVSYQLVSGESTKLPAAMKEKINREIELETMRKLDVAKPKKDIPSNQVSIREIEEASFEGTKLREKRRNPYAFAAAEASRKKKKLRESTIEVNGVTSKRQKLRYKFQEGFTTGIKRTVWIKDLL